MKYFVSYYYKKEKDQGFGDATIGVDTPITVETFETVRKNIEEQFQVDNVIILYYKEME